ncbi:MAG: alpha/beta hydrolase family protein [Promethearchaeia archaeon]
MRNIIPLNQKTIEKLKKLLFFAGLLLSIIGLAWTVIFNYPLLSCNIKHFQIQTAPEFRVFGENVEIDCALYLPKDNYDIYEKRPAIVYVHGFSSSKTYFKGFANEFGKRGFVGLCISGRAHGSSSGQFGFSWENETYSAVNWLRENAEQYNIDLTRIGVVGHSMGAFSVTLASLMDYQLGNHWINTTITVGGPQYDVEDQDMNRGIFSYLEQIKTVKEWFYPTINFDIDKAFDNMILKHRLNESKTNIPRNFLNIIGEFDEAFTVESAKELVWNLGREGVFGTTDYKQIETGKTYGIFADGSARRLAILKGEHHMTEAQNEVAIEESINWMEKSMFLDKEHQYLGQLATSELTETERKMGNLITIVGVILLAIPLSVYLGNKISPKKSYIQAAKEIEKSDLKKLVLTYIGLFLGTSAVTVPIISAFSLNTIIVTDFLITNIFMVILFIHALIFLPFLLGLIYYEKKKYGETRGDFGLGIGPHSLRRNLYYGIGFFLVIYLPLLVSFTLYGFKSLLIYRIVGFLEIWGVIFTFTFVYGLLFSGLIQSKYSRYEKEKLLWIPSWRELLYSIFLATFIGGTGLTIAYLILLTSIQFLLPVTLSVIPGFYLLFFLVSAINSWIYRKTRSIISTVIFTSFLLALLASIMLPSIYNSGTWVFTNF